MSRDALPKARHPENEFLVEHLHTVTRSLQASGRDRSQWRAVSLKKAMASVAAYPEELTNAQQMMKLKGVGQGYARMLEQEYVKRKGPPSSLEVSASSQSILSAQETESSDVSEGKSRKRRKLRNLPATNHISYAVLCVLHANKHKPVSLGNLLQLTNELRTQKLQMKAVTQEDVKNTFSKLENNENLVMRVRSVMNLDLYALSDAGVEFMDKNFVCNKAETSDGVEVVAGDLENECDNGLKKEFSMASSSSSCSSASSSFSCSVADLKNRGWATEHNKGNSHSEGKFTFTPGTGAEITPASLGPQIRNRVTSSPITFGAWELVLLVDLRELLGKQAKKALEGWLVEGNVNFEPCTLSLGDMLWIVRDVADPSKAFVTDYIIERKEVGDFASSIVDGRYAEQKFRLHRCGLKKVIYLVEGELAHVKTMLPATVKSAMAETQVRDGFMVQHCMNNRDTASFLVRMHHLISSVTTKAPEGKWSPNPLLKDKWRDFQTFQTANTKGRLDTVGDIFAAQVKQIPGFSGAKASAVVEKYPTPKSLLRLFSETLVNMPEDYKREFFTNLDIPGQTRKLGKELSHRLYDIFNPQHK